MKKIISLSNNNLANQLLSTSQAIPANNPTLSESAQQALNKDLKELTDLVLFTQRLHRNTASKESLDRHKAAVIEDIQEIRNILENTNSEMVKQSGKSVLRALENLIPRRRTGTAKVLGLVGLIDPFDGIDAGDIAGMWFGNRWLQNRKALDELTDKVERASNVHSPISARPFEATPTLLDLQTLIKENSKLINKCVSKTEIMKTMQNGSRFGFRNNQNDIFRSIQQIKKVAYQADQRGDSDTADKARRTIKSLKANIVDARRTRFGKVLITTLLTPTIIPIYYLYKWTRNRSNLNAIQAKIAGR